MKMLEQVPLAHMTTLGIGGPARYFVEAKNEDEVREGVQFAESNQLPLFVLGGGSNLVVADTGFAGLVLKVGIADVVSATTSNGSLTFDAGAGVMWDELVERSIVANCAGLECLSGIPGTVGGTPVQNVGAYGQEVSQTIQQVHAFDLHTLESRTLSNSECGFGYRSSIFNTTHRGQYLLLRVVFALTKEGPANLRYTDVQRFFAGMSGTPTLAQVRAAVLEIRMRKAMLIVPGDENSHSAGSFFKNPVVSPAFLENLSERLRARSLQLPSYPASEGFLKLPAAWLVEHAGFSKGYRKGAAAISRRHALAIINCGGATAAEIVALRDEIQQRVMTEFGIWLQPEPVFVGF